MRKIFITFVLLTSAVLAGANTVINVETAGTLKTLIGENKLTTTDLVVSGNLNGSDIQVIREMAGIMLSGGPSGGKLARLDMTDANIVAGGDYYMYDYNTYENFYTADNELGKYMFYNCPALQSVVIPKSVTAIGVEAFQDCKGLTSIDIPVSVANIGQGAFCDCTEIGSVAVPEGVTGIFKWTFYGCIKLLSVVLPASLTELGEGAFMGCRELTELSVPENVNIVPPSAFGNCKKLRKLSLPKAITQIGHYAASGCAALEELYLYAENPPSCGFYPFNGVDKQKCKLYVPKDTKVRYQSAGGFSDFNNIIEIETSGIAAILEDNNETVHYTIGGIPTKTPLKGINIVRTRDGKTRKIVVR